MASKSALIASLLFCLSLGCQPPDCDHEDCGSCGNACCTVEFRFLMDAEAVNDTMVTALKKVTNCKQSHPFQTPSGGADGRYKFVGSSDLRPYKLPSGAAFIMQAIHTTLVKHYNDTLNFVLAVNATKPVPITVVRAFSISQIQGALCDDGQNYKNLVGFIKGLLDSGYRLLVTAYNQHEKDFQQKTITGCTKLYD